MALPNTTLGYPKFDPIDIVGDALAAAHKDIDLSKLNRFLQNLVSQAQATPPAVTPPASTAKPSTQIIRATFANQPTGLWVNAEGTLWSVTDYGHLLRRTGAGWEFADAMGGYIAGRVVAPDGDGWVLCDGSSTHYLHVVAGVASEVAFTTPNLTGNPSYLKWASAYTGTLLLAIAPTLMTVSNTPTTGAAARAVLANADAEMARLLVLPYFRR